MKKILAALAATTMVVAPIASAEAHTVRDHYGHKIKHNHGRYYAQQRYQYRVAPRYDTRETYRYWKSRDGRIYCQRRDGTVGIIVGAAVGGLLGREIDRGEGTIIGGALGALLGREIARGNARCR